MPVAAFDVGGTNMNYGVLNEKGDILYKAEIPTEKSGGGGAIIQQIKHIVSQLSEHNDLTGIAVSTAGQIDKKKGFVIYATDSLPGYTGSPIKSDLEEDFHLPVVVDNDVNCAALGEYWKGSAKDVNDFLCMTLGTGIGGAIVIDGKIYDGVSYSAGEFGHMTLYPDGEPCSCGDNGCYECYASSRALKQRASDHFQKDISLPELFNRAKKDHSKNAISVIDRWTDDVALGLKTLVHIFNPGLIVIGGGVSGQGNFLLKKIEQRLYPRLMSSFRGPLKVRLAQNGNDANLQGAVYQLLNT